MIRKIWVLVLLTLPTTAGAQSITLLTSCPATPRACVEMTVGVEDLSTILVSRGEPYGIGYSDLVLRLPVKEGDGSVGAVKVELTAFTEGIACSAFGQATVAVTGFSDDGDPRLLTSTGSIVVLKNALRVGCPTCTALLEEGRNERLEAATSPAWALHLVGVSHREIGYTDAGSLLVIQRDRCFEIPIAGPIVEHVAGACEPAAVIGDWKDPVPGVSLEPTQALLKAPGTERLLLLDTGACT